MGYNIMALGIIITLSVKKMEQTMIQNQFHYHPIFFLIDLALVVVYYLES